MKALLEDTQPIQITDNIWWTGFADFESGFSNNSYLYLSGKESVLVDPGPAHPVFKDIITRKIGEIVPLESIRYIILQHQDPDICGLVPYLENLLHPELTIICHPRTALFVPYYGIRRGILPVGDEDTLLLSNGNKLKFYHLPYLHFSGNIATYAPDDSALFSSDIFAFFDRSWSFYVNESRLDKCRSFIQNYFGSEEALRYAYQKLKSLDLQLILAQHGGVIKEDIDKFLGLLRESHPAMALKSLGRKANEDQEQKLFQIGKEWFAEWKKTETHAENIEELYTRVLKEGPSAAAIFLDVIEKHALDMGVNNPLLSGRVFSSKTLRQSEPSTVINSVRRRYMQKFYSDVPLNTENDSYNDGFTSFKTDLVIIFIDIRKFTEWCEGKVPDEVMKYLNNELGLISKAIEQAGGRVNKLLGDGILAYFPMNLIGKAVTLLFQIHTLIRKNKLLPVGIGCDAGPIIMGDIGRENRLDYTLLGQPVNIAARACNKAAEYEVVLTDNVRQHLSHQNWEKILKKHSHSFHDLKGKAHDPVVKTHVFTTI